MQISRGYERGKRMRQDDAAAQCSNVGESGCRGVAGHAIGSQAKDRKKAR